MVFNVWKRFFRERNHIKSYLSDILEFATHYKSTDLYFYIDNENIRVFYNPKNELRLYQGLKPFCSDKLTTGLYERLTTDMLGLNRSLEPLNLPEGFIELTTTPRRYQEGLEHILAKKFGYKNIYDVNDYEKFCKLKIKGNKIETSLTRIPSREGTGYHLRFYYND